jgi:hypothetical protein
VNSVAGQSNKKQKRPINRIHRAYREPCIEFADNYGYQHDWIATHFEEFWLMRQFECRMHSNLAAYCAMRDVYACFFKQGAGECS